MQRKWNTPSPSFYFSGYSENFRKQLDLKIQYSNNLFLKELDFDFMTEKFDYLVTLIPFSGLFHWTRKSYVANDLFSQCTNCLCVFKSCWKSFYFLQHFVWVFFHGGRAGPPGWWYPQIPLPRFGYRFKLFEFLLTCFWVFDWPSVTDCLLTRVLRLYLFQEFHHFISTATVNVKTLTDKNQRFISWKFYIEISLKRDF